MKYYSIKDVSNATGLTSYTIRYYEKIGFLPLLKRDKNGVRIFTESDIKYLECLIFFKKIGMSLDDIKEIIKEGCMIKDFKNGLNVHDIIQKRLNILDTHIK
ncbi:MerR family transcriptional regulator [Clostridium ljungdahlii]|uniref:HTH-type transcriptional regulator YfmP n=1 Tax=Clostridium ljungdahlii TaxID=1538 RepID=A0A168LKE1_9CLOT|nr:MerR family transcriptional regulator [Clostridium ljungdahlii]OAA83350.1 HTH-type transcriptional regulator YfmP [Clostridium ljungdahlii]